MNILKYTKRRGTKNLITFFFIIIPIFFPLELAANTNNQTIKGRNACSTQILGDNNVVFCYNLQPNEVIKKIENTLDTPVDQSVRQLLFNIPQPSSSSGVYGVVYVRWLDLPSHEGFIIMNGSYGILRVTFYNYFSNYIEVVDQDMTFTYFQGVPYLVGYNPRYAGTSIPHPQYLPDVFLLNFNPNINLYSLSLACSFQSCSRIQAQTIY